MPSKISKALADRWRHTEGIGSRKGRFVCSDSEWAAFLDVVEQTGLDPDRKQIYLQNGKPALTIDGMRVLSNQKDEADGHDGPYWLHSDNEWHDFPPMDGDPLAAKVTVFKKGCQRGFTGVAKFSEFYNQGRAHGSRMIAKCAEADALRKAFADLLSRLYIGEELDNIHADKYDRGDDEQPQRPSVTLLGSEAAMRFMTKLEESGVKLAELREFAAEDDFVIPQKLDELPRDQAGKLKMCLDAFLEWRAIQAAQDQSGESGDE